MSATAGRPVAERVFRAADAFELVLFDRLPPEEQSALAELTADPDFYGILRPTAPGGLTIRSVNRDTALLWLTMRSPGTLPSFVLARDPELVGTGVWQLVLDGVLETDEGGRFISGADAAKLLEPGADPRPRGTLAAKSACALRHADRLKFDGATELAEWLYRYGTQPMVPQWFQRLRDRASVLEFVGAGRGTARQRAMASRWQTQPDKAGWISWSSSDRSATGTTEATYKLYVSPRIEAVPDAFAGVLETAHARMLAFKIGDSAAGLLRPDKMVLYFDSVEDLFTAASDLDRRLAGLPAHGVPFTAQVSASGMLSWGMDPPRGERRLAWQDVESWRLWVVRRLALAMQSARVNHSAGVSSADFAVERLRHEGVDVNEWKPAMHLWRAA